MATYEKEEQKLSEDMKNENEYEIQKIYDDIQKIKAIVGDESEQSNSSSDHISHFEDISDLEINEDKIGDLSPETVMHDIDNHLYVSPLEYALILNQLYQKKMIDMIYECRIALENEERYQKDSSNSISDIYHHSNKQIWQFAAPYFRNTFGTDPAPNTDSLSKEKQWYLDAYFSPPKMWNSAEKTRLIKGILKNYKKQLMEPFLYRKDFILSKLDDDLESEEKESLKRKLKALQNEIDIIKSKHKKDLIVPRGMKLDWLEIACHHMKGSRSPEDCELRWNNLLHPSINNKQWDTKEDERLMELAKETNGTEWEYIAKELNTNRTPFQCIQRYHQKLNPVYFVGPWTPEEDNLLMEVIKYFRCGNNIPWHQVSYYIDGRSRQQIQTRWSQTLNPRLRFGKWSKQEDLLLLAAVKRYGEFAWPKVASHVPGRTNVQCRERYVNTLCLNLAHKPWKKEEDVLLVKLVKINGEGRWADLTRHFEGRTDNQLLQRYRRICARHPRIKTVPLDKLSSLLKKIGPSLAPTRMPYLKPVKSLHLHEQLSEILDPNKEQDVESEMMQMPAQQHLPPTLDRFLTVRSRMMESVEEKRIERRISRRSTSHAFSAPPSPKPEVPALDFPGDTPNLLEKEFFEEFERWINCTPHHSRKIVLKPRLINRSANQNSVRIGLKKVISQALNIDYFLDSDLEDPTSLSESEDPSRVFKEKFLFRDEIIQHVSQILQSQILDVEKEAQFPDLMPLIAPNIALIQGLQTLIYLFDKLSCVGYEATPHPILMKESFNKSKQDDDAIHEKNHFTKASHLEEFEHQYELLKKRMISLFFFPSLFLKVPCKKIIPKISNSQCPPFPNKSNKLPNLELESDSDIEDEEFKILQRIRRRKYKQEKVTSPKSKTTINKTPGHRGRPRKLPLSSHISAQPQNLLNGQYINQNSTPSKVLNTPRRRGRPPKYSLSNSNATCFDPEVYVISKMPSSSSFHNDVEQIIHSHSSKPTKVITITNKEFDALKDEPEKLLKFLSSEAPLSAMTTAMASPLKTYQHKSQISNNQQAPLVQTSDPSPLPESSSTPLEIRINCDDNNVTFMMRHSSPPQSSFTSTNIFDINGDPLSIPKEEHKTLFASSILDKPPNENIPKNDANVDHPSDILKLSTFSPEKQISFDVTQKPDLPKIKKRGRPRKNQNSSKYSNISSNAKELAISLSTEDEEKPLMASFESTIQDVPYSDHSSREHLTKPNSSPFSLEKQNTFDISPKQDLSLIKKRGRPRKNLTTTKFCKLSPNKKELGISLSTELKEIPLTTSLENSSQDVHYIVCSSGEYFTKPSSYLEQGSTAGIDHVRKVLKSSSFSSEKQNSFDISPKQDLSLIKKRGRPRKNQNATKYYDLSLNAKELNESLSKEEKDKSLTSSLGKTIHDIYNIAYSSGEHVTQTSSNQDHGNSPCGNSNDKLITSFFHRERNKKDIKNDSLNAKKKRGRPRKADKVISNELYPPSNSGILVQPQEPSSAQSLENSLDNLDHPPTTVKLVHDKKGRPTKQNQQDLNKFKKGNKPKKNNESLINKIPEPQTSNKRLRAHSLKQPSKLNVKEFDNFIKSKDGQVSTFIGTIKSELTSLSIGSNSPSSKLKIMNNSKNENICERKKRSRSKKTSISEETQIENENFNSEELVSLLHLKNGKVVNNAMHLDNSQVKDTSLPLKKNYNLKTITQKQKLLEIHKKGSRPRKNKENLTKSFQNQMPLEPSLSKSADKTLNEPLFPNKELHSPVSKNIHFVNSLCSSKDDDDQEISFKHLEQFSKTLPEKGQENNSKMMVNKFHADENVENLNGRHIYENNHLFTTKKRGRPKKPKESLTKTLNFQASNEPYTLSSFFPSVHSELHLGNSLKESINNFNSGVQDKTSSNNKRRKNFKEGSVNSFCKTRCLIESNTLMEKSNHADSSLSSNVEMQVLKPLAEIDKHHFDLPLFEKSFHNLARSHFVGKKVNLKSNLSSVKRRESPKLVKNGLAKKQSSQGSNEQHSLPKKSSFSSSEKYIDYDNQGQVTCLMPHSSLHDDSKASLKNEKGSTQSLRHKKSNKSDFKSSASHQVNKLIAKNEINQKISAKKSKQSDKKSLVQDGDSLYMEKRGTSLEYKIEVKNKKKSLTPKSLKPLSSKKINQTSNFKNNACQTKTSPNKSINEESKHILKFESFHQENNLETLSQNSREIKESLNSSVKDKILNDNLYKLKKTSLSLRSNRNAKSEIENIRKKRSCTNGHSIPSKVAKITHSKMVQSQNASPSPLISLNLSQKINIAPEENKKSPSFFNHPKLIENASQSLNSLFENITLKTRLGHRKQKFYSQTDSEDITIKFSKYQTIQKSLAISQQKNIASSNKVKSNKRHFESPKNLSQSNQPLEVIESDRYKKRKKDNIVCTYNLNSSPSKMGGRVMTRSSNRKLDNLQTLKITKTKYCKNFSSTEHRHSEELQNKHLVPHCSHQSEIIPVDKMSEKNYLSQFSLKECKVVVDKIRFFDF